MSSDLHDRAWVAFDHEVCVVGQDRKGTDGVITLGRRDGEAVGDCLGLWSCETYRRVLQRGFGGSSFRGVVRDLRQ